MKLIHELQRRRVFQTAALYIVAAWVVLQVADLAFPGLNVPENAIRYVWIGVFLGFPVALLFGWRYQVTAKGIVRTTATGPGKTTVDLKLKAFDYVLLSSLVLVATAIFFGVVREIREADNPQSVGALSPEVLPNSIAVLPFVDMSAAGDQEYMSDGVAEELLNLLSRVRGLKVISRSSAFSFKGKDVDVPTIAEALKVGHILEGSVRKAGNKIRITAQLIEARTDTHVWSETFDRDLGDIFAIQDEIAATVVDKLQITLLEGTAKVRQTDPEAYALYLQGRFFGEQTTVEGNRKAVKAFKQALEIDPEHAPSWTWLATAYGDLENSRAMPVEESLPLMRNAAQQALLLDPQNAEAHSTLGWISAVYDHDYQVSAKYMQRALELAPSNLQVIRGTALLFERLGRHEDSRRVLEYVAKLDPISNVVRGNLAITYALLGRWDDVVESAKIVLELNPDTLWVHAYLGDAFLFLGDYEGALREYAIDPNAPVENLAGMTIAYFALGNTLEYERSVSELRSQYGDAHPWAVAWVYALIGETDAAFEWLDRQIARGTMEMAMVTESYFAPLTEDPRWPAKIEQLRPGYGASAAVSFDVNLPE